MKSTVGIRIQQESEASTIDAMLPSTPVYGFRRKQGRLDLPTLNSILDRVHDASIPNRVRTPNLEVQRSHMDDERRLSEQDRVMGPGYYDAEKYFEYRDRAAHKKHSFTLSKAKRPVFLPFVDQDIQRSKSLDLQTAPAISSSLQINHVGIKSNVGFGREPRWRRSYYTKASNNSTSTLGLGPDYDKSFQRLSYGTFSKASRDNAEKPGYRITPIDVDCGGKASLATKSLKHGRPYSSVFRSNTPSGLSIRPPTSGSVGPGDFPGAEIPAITIKDPYNMSAAFMSLRTYEQRTLAPESSVEIKTFQEVNPKGARISATGAKPGKTHIIEWTRKKVVKIYPKLAKKLYSRED